MRMRWLGTGTALAVWVGSCGGDTPNGPQTGGEDPLPLRVVEVETGLADPVHLTAPPGDDRLFVVEQAGLIRILRDGALLPEPFLDLRDRVRSGRERGLLSVAFHPSYAANGLLFVNYTSASGSTRVERYQVTPDPDRADPSSARRILEIEQPFANHNGGHVLFGPDGMLYVAMGDGGSGGDPQRHGQNRSTLLGAILRIDVDRGDPYGVPADNPYVDDPAFRDEIWAYGVRNPWRIAFDADQNRLYVADVGQNRIEEVTVVPADQAGLNLGWAIMEGSECFGGGGCGMEGIVLPTVEYDHSQGCSITGGLVYRGGAIPEIQGRYFYSDYCSGWLRSFHYSGGAAAEQHQWNVGSLGSVTSFGVDGAGELHIVTAEGRVLRIERGS